MNASAEMKLRFNTRQDMLEVGAVFILIPIVLYYYRNQIFLFLVKPFQSKQRLVDGAFIAALMEQMDDNTSSEQGDIERDGRKRDLIAESAALIRRVNMSQLNLGTLA
eukprot:COSAG05_NODE_2939_length_2486_cov_3.528697_2_plen_107_part_01